VTAEAKTNVMNLGQQSDLLSWADLVGSDAVTLKVKAVTVGNIVGDGGRTTPMALVEFVGTPKKLALNITNKKAFIKHYASKYVEDWIDKPITLYVTTTMLRGERVNCIRVRDGAR
jgi:hypothetical protein